jgi:hypothetical protein
MALIARDQGIRNGQPAVLWHPPEETLIKFILGSDQLAIREARL